MSKNKDPFAGLKPESGWKKFRLPIRIGSDRFAGVDPDAQSVRMCFFERERDHALVGWVFFGDFMTGPPGHAHGGSQAFALDEAMGAAAWLAGRPSVAGELGFKFFDMVPLNAHVAVEAWVESVAGKKAVVKSQLKSAAGKIYAEGHAVFVRLEPEKIEKLATLAGIPVEEFAEYIKSQNYAKT